MSVPWGSRRTTRPADTVAPARHGISRTDAEHAVAHAIVVVDMDPDADPPKTLYIGPAASGQLLEVISLELADDRTLIIHAMALRAVFHDLLSTPDGDI